MADSASASGSPPKPAEREHADPSDPVATGRRAEQHREIARARRAPEHQPVDREDPEAQHVDQGILRVGRVEGELAADRRHPDRVPVAGDPRHYSFDQPPLARLDRIAEEERVHDRDRPRTHGEDVAEDATHAGGGSLVGLDRRRVVVALDADGDRDPVTGVDHPRVLAGADQHPRSLGRQAAEVDPRRLVGAVLAPHDREEGELEMVGRAIEDVLDLVTLGVGEAERAVEVLFSGGALGLMRAHGASVPAGDRAPAEDARTLGQRVEWPGRESRVHRPP